MTRRWKLGDWLFNTANYTFMVLLAAATLYPFLYVLACSFSDPLEVISGRVTIWPRGLSTEAYEIVLGARTLWTAYGNTLFYVAAGTTLNVVMTMLGAYPLSRRTLYGRGLFSFIIVLTMFFGAGMIPSFLLIKTLNLLNTRWAMILPGAVSAWLLIMTRTYIQANVPDELVEAAQIDGANDVQIMARVVVPVSLPIMAVIALFYAVGHWNEYVSALIYLRDLSLMPLQVVLRQIVIANQVSAEFLQNMDQVERAWIGESVKHATIIVATAPILFFYPFLQRYFVKGMLIGSLKG